MANLGKSRQHSAPAAISKSAPRNNPGNPAIPPAPDPSQPEPSRDPWLESEKNWKHRVGKGWVAKKVLGRGGFGIVGHWAYEGADRAQKQLVDVAIKQGSVDFDGGFTNEEEIYLALNPAKSKHIPQMYRRMYEDQGQNTVAGGYDSGEVHRMYLEYCPGGDLHSWQKNLRFSNPTQYPSEENMWAFFHCMALAALVLHHGSEDPSTRKWDKDIVHLDIKQPNLLLGAAISDSEHNVSLPPLKVCDFGLSINAQAPHGYRQSQHFRDKYGRRGTPGYYLPEQTNEQRMEDVDSWPWMGRVPNRQYGSKGNVWQIAFTMWCLQHQLPYIPSWRVFMLIYKSVKRARPNQVEAYTVGTERDRDEEQDDSLHKTRPAYAYSNALKSLIKECLLILPELRPDPHWLVKRTRKGLYDIRMVNGKLSPLIPFPVPAQSLYPDPTISTGWYDGQSFGTPAQAKLQHPEVLAPTVRLPGPATPSAMNLDDQPIIPQIPPRQPASRAAAPLPTAAQAHSGKNRRSDEDGENDEPSGSVHFFGESGDYYADSDDEPSLFETDDGEDDEG